MREPTHTECSVCEEERPYAYGEVDIDDDGREVFVCKQCTDGFDADQIHALLVEWVEANEIDIISFHKADQDIRIKFAKMDCSSKEALHLSTNVSMLIDGDGSYTLVWHHTGRDGIHHALNQTLYSPIHEYDLLQGIKAFLVKCRALYHMELFQYVESDLAVKALQSRSKALRKRGHIIGDPWSSA